MSKKTLDQVIGDVEKKFGKGMVRSMDEYVDIERSSSGSIGLDVALGGGYPKGRIIEIYGPESSGKCLTEDSYVYTLNGYKTIKQIFNNQGLETYCINKEVESTYPLINKNGDIENTTHFTFNGRRKVYKVRTKSGFVHKGTYKHPLMCISENGNLVWKWIGEINENDYVVSKHTISNFGEINENEDFAYLVGLLIADGSLQKERISITNDDEEIKEFIESSVPNLMGVDFKQYNNNDHGSVDYHFNSKKKIDEFYDKTGLTSAKSKHKSLSEYIMSFNKKAMSSFLCGYLDSESYMYDSGLEVSSASYELLYQIKLILSQYSIFSTLYQKEVKSYPENDYWILHFSGHDYLKFIRNIGLKYSKSNKQKAKMLEYSNQSENRGTLSNIPNILSQIKDLYKNSPRNRNCGSIIHDLELKQLNCSKAKLVEILEYCPRNEDNKHIFDNLSKLLEYYYDQVEKIEELEPQPTFDFSLPDTHSFIADGCINHNTTTALHAVVEVQKAGKMAIYLDYENAIDPYYCECIGVDLSSDKFRIINPDDTESGFEIMRSFLDVESVGIIVVDSVAAMAPKAELQGDFGDSKIGLQARAMSQGMRMLVQGISKSNVIVMFINQTRDKIGVVFGSPETTTGGNALKFYASQRIRVSKSGGEKDSDGEQISINSKIKVIKNKVAPPMRNCEVPIKFGLGFDKLTELVNLAVEQEIVMKRGSWYNYGDVKLGQGIDNVRAIMEDNPEMLEEIEHKVRTNLGLIEDED